MTSGTTGSLTASQTLLEAAGRTADLLRGVQRPDAAAPGLDWTVSETAAHVVAEFTDYAAFASGQREAGSPLGPGGTETAARRGASSNTSQLSRFTERDMSRLAAMVVPVAEEFLAAAASHSPDDRIVASNGLSMTPQTMTAALLGELLVHGLDIARAEKIPWRISGAEALHVVAGVMAMVPDYLDRQRAAGLHVSYELRFRGGPRYRVVVDDGAATVSDALTPAGPRPDCWISADPAAFLLVGYGRTGQWTQIAHGKLLAGGRKPWLGLAFGQLITGP